MRQSHRKVIEKRHQEDIYSKATRSLFPIKMIAKLERTQNIAQQNKEHAQKPTNAVVIYDQVHDMENVFELCKQLSFPGITHISAETSR